MSRRRTRDLTAGIIIYTRIYLATHIQTTSSYAAMLSYKKGIPIASVLTRAEHDRLIRLAEIPDHFNGRSKVLKNLTYDIRIDDGQVVPLPSKDTERIYIAGKSGSGKSYLASQYMKEYRRIFPDRKIYLFSRHQDEKTYNDIQHIAIELNEELIEDPIDVSELENSLVVFDDTDNLATKRLNDALKLLNNDLITNGRKYGIHVLTLAHQLLDYQKTRNLLNEANKVVFFNNGSSYHINRYLKTYAGLAPDEIADLLRTVKGSRWTMFHTGNPTYILHQHGASIVGQHPTPGTRG